MNSNTNLVTSIERLFTTRVSAMVLNLDRIRHAWQMINTPQPAPIIIAVAGTNGKGTVANFLGAAYTSAGYRTGVFTSPHLCSLTERFVINGKPISEAMLDDTAEQVAQATKNIPLTFFEATTLIMAQCFSQARLDIAIIEVGLGGRLDATALFPNRVSIITSISYDHTDYLGNTLPAIAKEKSGIILKSTKTAIVAADGNDAIFQNVCDANNVCLLRFGEEILMDVDYDTSRLRITLNQKTADYTLPASAVIHSQLRNYSLAISCIHTLQETLPVAHAVLEHQVKNLRVAGRLHKSVKYPHILLDVAHNPASVRELLLYISHNPNFQGGYRVLCGFNRDKPVETMITLFMDQPVRQWLGVCACDNQGINATQLLSLISSAHNSPPKQITIEQTTIEAGLSAFIKDSIPTLIFGSFMVVGQALQILNEDPCVKRA